MDREKTHGRKAGVVRRAGNVLLVMGMTVGLTFVLLEYQVSVAQRTSAVNDTSETPPRPGVSSPGGPEDKSRNSESVRVPELSLAAPITGDIGPIELIHGVGHIPGTAMAGGLGTMGLAGHRDTFFRELRRVQAGMQVLVTGRDGTYRYVVDRTEIVDPSRVDVLGIQQTPRLILVTCYPFSYIGAAPKRFIVFAHLTSADPITR